MTVQTIPILPSSDFDTTAEFFGLLGFEAAGRWVDSYLIIEHPIGIELHFFWHEGLSPRANDHGAYIRFSAAEAVLDLHERWCSLELGSGRVTSPEPTDYGLVEFALLDPMNNLLRIGGFLQPPK